MWERDPLRQSGLHPNWYKWARRSSITAGKKLVRFVIDMPYQRLVSRLRAFARMHGHDWVVHENIPYMVVRSGRPTAR
jgi:hypothetical protein